jgi:hypothetical protein
MTPWENMQFPRNLSTAMKAQTGSAAWKKAPTFITASSMARTVMMRYRAAMKMMSFMAETVMTFSGAD